MKNIEIKKTSLKNLKIIQHVPIKDNRGFLSRLFCQKTLNKLINGKTICQINKTLTRKKGTIRGLHFQQSPFAEIKIISCLKGKVWDVVVDLRKGSPTFLNYHSEILSANNHKSFLIPEGFAHGFQTLTSDCEMLYFHTANYNKKFEKGINVFDRMIGIKWPKKITAISKRDKNHIMLNDNFKGIKL
jgi:dTDP-4-dehydrorhamnose 3,5-epimerase